MPELHLIIAMSTSYTVGCLATGYYLVLLATGKDIRTLCSGGIGARNVSRVLGLRAALITVLGDAGKGMLAVYLADLIGSDRTTALVAMMAVTAGHIWPGQLGFRGGKGVATSLGGLLVWNPFLYAVFAVFFLLTLLASRDSTIAVSACYAVLPVAALIAGATRFEWIGLGLLSSLIIYLHRDNIRVALHARRQDGLHGGDHGDL
jgi:acyl phosphate:glycerol-3-phosphate acyltransferase